MPDRYPGYDVLKKRHTPSWNEQTRRVIDARLAMRREPRFFSLDEWSTLTAVCDRVVPQPKHRPAVPIAALIDEKMFEDKGDGFRDSRLPRMQEAWRRGLAALDGEAVASHGLRFHALGAIQQDELLRKMQGGGLTGAAWGGMPCKVFFKDRVLSDVTGAYYSHPTSWNEIGFGGPASPRGYVRMNFDRRDPWEASETSAGREQIVRRQNQRVG